jgi:hypothetical protein
MPLAELRLFPAACSWSLIELNVLTAMCFTLRGRMAYQTAPPAPAPGAPAPPAAPPAKRLLLHLVSARAAACL